MLAIINPNAKGISNIIPINLAVSISIILQHSQSLNLGTIQTLSLQAIDACAHRKLNSIIVQIHLTEQ